MHKLIKNYKADVYFDELIDHEGNPRRSAQSLIQCLDSLAPDELEKRRLTAEATIQEMGISFTVYTDTSSDGVPVQFTRDVMLQHDASSAARYGKSALFTASDYGDADARLSERGE